MSARRGKLKAAIAPVALLICLSACESTGSTRFSSVSAAGAQGPQGIQGEPGPTGATGPAGPVGPAGPAGSVGLGSAGALAVGGLVGPGGVAGTGLLANTGNPGATNPILSGVLVRTGQTVGQLAERGAILADRLDAGTPGGTRLVGRVVDTVRQTGIALVRTGEGREYLVDGLTAAPGQLVQLTIGNARVLGSGASPLIGASVLSGTQARGDALTVGVGSEGRLLTLGNGTAGQPPSGTPTPHNPVGAVTNVVQGVTGGLLNGGQAPAPGQPAAPGATGLVQGVVQGVTQGLTGATGVLRRRGGN